MPIVAAALVSLALLAGPVPMPRPSLPEVQFTPIAKTQAFELNFDEKTFNIIKRGETPIVQFDIELIMAKPDVRATNNELIKRYVNTVSIDCFNEQAIVIVGRGFSAAGVLIYVSSEPMILPPTVEQNSPIAILVGSVCPAIYNNFKAPDAQEKPQQKRFERPKGLMV